MTVAVAPVPAVGRPRFDALPPLAIYVHVPWCVRKCPYCDFNSHEAKGELPADAYVDALVADLESALPSIWGRGAVSVFIGGGTPSLLPAAAVDRLLAAIRARVPLAPQAEITPEGNLFNNSAELALFWGADHKPLACRQRQFLDGWIPVVRDSWQDGSLVYEYEVFGAILDGFDEKNTLQFVKLTVRNTGAAPAPAHVIGSVRHDGGKYRERTGGFNPKSNYAFTDGWLFRDGDVEDIAQKISYAIQNRQQFETIGEAARGTAEQRADWKKNFGKLLEVYNKLSR